MTIAELVEAARQLAAAVQLLGELMQLLDDAVLSGQPITRAQRDAILGQNATARALLAERIRQKKDQPLA